MDWKKCPDYSDRAKRENSRELNSKSLIHPISNPGHVDDATSILNIAETSNAGKNPQNRLRRSLDLRVLGRSKSNKLSNLFADSSFLIVALCQHPRELEPEHFLL
jgi:hypothetical protein